MTEPANEQALDEAPFFDGGGRGQVLDQLGHLAAWARSLVMLTAPLGGGKTLLLDRVVAQVEQRGNTNIVRPPVGFLSTGHELLRHVAADLGAHVPEQIDAAGLQQLVLQQVFSEVADDRSTLLVLDDAHELSADVLRTVAQLVDDARSSRGLNVLITGEASLPDQMAKATPARENWHEIRLRPLPLQEVRQFLRAYRPDAFASLDAVGVQTIAKRSGGWPGRILNQVDGEVSRQKRFRGRFPLVHLLWLGAMAAALTVVLMMQYRANNKPKVQVATDASVVESLALPVAIPAVPTAVAGRSAAAPVGAVALGEVSAGAQGTASPPAAALPPSQRIPVPRAPDSLPDVAPRPPVAIPPVARALPVPEFQMPAVATPHALPLPANESAQARAASTTPALRVTPPVTAGTPAPAVVDHPLKPLPTTTAQRSAVQISVPKPVQISTAATPANVATATPANVATTTPANVATTTPANVATTPAIAQTASAITQTVAAAPAPPHATSSATATLENGWAKQQSPSSFTVQLFGSASLASAQHYVNTHRAASLRVLHTKKRGASGNDAGHDAGHDWYVVVLGSFRSRGEALSAQRQVPGSANNQPWVRTFDGLQKEIP